MWPANFSFWLTISARLLHFIFGSHGLRGNRPLFDYFEITDGLKPTQIWAFEAAWAKVIERNVIWRLHPTLLTAMALIILFPVFSIVLTAFFSVAPIKAEGITALSGSFPPISGFLLIILIVMLYRWFQRIRQDNFFTTCKQLASLVKQLESEKMGNSH